MWWERWIPERYLTKSAVCAVECLFDETGVRYHYVLLQTRKNKIELEKEGALADLSEVQAIAKKASAPVSLVLTGKGVILKKIMLGENSDTDLRSLLQQHLPAVQSTDFYVQLYRSGAHAAYIALCRREQLDQQIAPLKKQKVDIADVFIGPAVCNTLAAITASYNRLTTPGQRLELSAGFLDEVQPVADTEPVILQMDGVQVAPSGLLAFAAGFGYLTRQQVYATDQAELACHAQHHSEAIRLRILVFALIAVLFVASSVNSVVFFQKYEESSTLDVELNLYETKNTQITKLLEEYQKKKSLIEQAGVFEHKKISLYADKIAASLPQDIVLKELYFNPENGETPEDSLADFRQNELIIKGNCSKSLLLNDWVNVLKSQSFVRSVDLENFVFHSDGHLPNFVLRVKTE